MRLSISSTKTKTMIAFLNRKKLLIHYRISSDCKLYFVFSTPLCSCLAKSIGLLGYLNMFWFLLAISPTTGKAHQTPQDRKNKKGRVFFLLLLLLLLLFVNNGSFHFSGSSGCITLTFWFSVGIIIIIR